jgi:hypothetical protein
MCLCDDDNLPDLLVTDTFVLSVIQFIANLDVYV